MSPTKDPRTGKFAFGNSGRPKGSKNRGTRQWEAIGEMLVNERAAKVADVLDELLKSEQVRDKVKGVELFLKMVEFFKAKRKREAAPSDPWSLDDLLNLSRR